MPTLLRFLALTTLGLLGAGTGSHTGPPGSRAGMQIVVDDSAVVWLDAHLARRLGQTGGSLIAGFTAPNRVVLTRDARPGQQIQIAVFGANGPLSDPPANFIWVRSATLDFHKPAAPAIVPGVQVTRLDPGLDAIVPPDLTIEKLADGFQFLEGPVWVREGGHLLFSDPNANTIYAYTPEGRLSLFRAKSGYPGPDIGEDGQPGSHRPPLDPEGRP